MASLMKSLSNMIRKKKDDLTGAISNPVTDGKYAIEDSEKQIAEFTEKIAKLIAETRRLSKDRDACDEEIAKYMAIARRAAEKENEEDVRQAVMMKSKAEARKATLDAEVVKSEALTEKLRGQLNQARVKVADAKCNLSRLAARMEGAEVRKDLAKASTSFSDSESPLTSLDDLQKAVEGKESEAEAWEELSGQEDPEKKLEEKYMAEGDKAVDNEVAALMASVKKGKK